MKRPKNALGKAIQYAQNQKDKFYTMLENGDVGVDKLLPWAEDIADGCKNKLDQ